MAKVNGTSKPKASTESVKKQVTKASKARISAEALKTQGSELAKQYSKEQIETFGKDSDRLAALYPLYSPTSTQTKTKSAKGGTGKRESENGFKVIGLQVKNVSEEPITLILGTITGRTALKTPLEVFKGESRQDFVLEPGKEIGLTNAELFVNILLPQFAGRITGGDYIYSISELQSQQNLDIPNVKISASIKDPETQTRAPRNTDIYKPIATKDENKKVTPLKGYERWAKFLETSKSSTRTGGKRKVKEDFSFLTAQDTIKNLLG